MERRSEENPLWRSRFLCALFAIFRVIQVFVWKIFNEALCECVCACEHVYKYVIYKLAAIFGGLH